MFELLTGEALRSGRGIWVHAVSFDASPRCPYNPPHPVFFKVGDAEMDLELRGKNAIVTGGGSNIGRSIVLTLAEEGANIAVFDVDEDTADRVVQEARDAGAARRTVRPPHRYN